VRYSTSYLRSGFPLTRFLDMLQSSELPKPRGSPPREKSAQIPRTRYIFLHKRFAASSSVIFGKPRKGRSEKAKRRRERRKSTFCLLSSAFCLPRHKWRGFITRGLKSSGLARRLKHYPRDESRGLSSYRLSSLSIRAGRPLSTGG